MIQFLRSFFGLNEPSSNRTVVGTSAGIDFDLKEIAYIKDSNNRLVQILTLSKKYKGTPHEDKIKSVYEKTKKIHEFLLSKKKIYELELFHIGYTEHFISTFNLIIDVHQSHKEDTFATSEPQPEITSIKEPVVEVPLTTDESKNGRSKGELFEIAERVRQRKKQTTSVYTEEPRTEVPRVAIPEISIDTIAKVFFLREDVSGKPVPDEISFVSTQQEKEAFQSYVSARLGIDNIYYVGNARISLPNSKDRSQGEMVPVIYWSKFSYALALNNYRIFPVTINRRSL